MPEALQWKLANAEAALSLVSNEALGSPSIDSRPVGLELEPNLSFGGESAGRLALNIRGALTVAALNDPTDEDEDGIVGDPAAATPAGTLPPQLTFDRVYLKYRAEAGVKAKGDFAVGNVLGIDASAQASTVFADYRVHGKDEPVRSAVRADIEGLARFVTRLDDVLTLAHGEALAFRFGGSVSAGLTLSWSDMFTGPIGALGTLLGTTAPVSFSVKAGATLALSVTVSDDFVIVFSRVDDTRWRLGVRKVTSSRVAPSADVGINVGFADPGQLTDVIGTLLDGALGAPFAKVQEVLDAASLESLSPVQRRIATALIERFELTDERATIEGLRERVTGLVERIRGVVENAVRTRIALSFAYEYSRVSNNTNLAQATLDTPALQQLHGHILAGKTEPLVMAVQAKTPGIVLEQYLNEKEVTRTHSWGFTLGFGKWATLGGTDFKTIKTVRRTDVRGRLQESYLGARSYKGHWAGESMEWGVDLKADMKDYAAEPKVNDFSFGIHILWAAEQKNLSREELEQWLDTAVVWRVLRERDLADIRARVSGTLATPAASNVQLMIPNGVVQAILPALARAPLHTFAPALAVAMPWIKGVEARTDVSQRQQLYTPLWTMYLEDSRQSQSAYAQAAFTHLQKAGHLNAATRETFGQQGPDPFSFAGLTRINGDTRRECEAFTRGTRILRDAIISGARNQKTIDTAIEQLDGLWTQSHHVRAIGAHLLDAAERAGVLSSVTRTLTITAEGSPDLVVTA